MATYSEDDLRRIAEAVSKPLAEVMRYRHAFEAAAMWYRSDCRTAPQVAPYKIVRRAKQISETARKLLRYLKVYDYRNAADGPSDLTLLQFFGIRRRSA